MNLIQKYRNLAFYLTIHAYSLVLGAVFRSCYWIIGNDKPITQFFLSKYCSSRRLLPGGYDPKLKRSTRHGAREAYNSTQDI